MCVTLAEMRGPRQPSLRASAVRSIWAIALEYCSETTCRAVERGFYQKLGERTAEKTRRASASLSHRVPQAELPVPRRRATGRGQHLRPPFPVAPRRLHRLAALVPLPLGHRCPCPGVDDSDLSVSAGGGDQAPVTVE